MSADAVAERPAAAAERPASGAEPAGPLVPSPYRVVARIVESDDVATLLLEPVDAPVAPPRPGQFNLLTAFGIGEAAISVSGAPSEGALLRHTVRAVGPVSRALFDAGAGEVVGVRGPCGHGWDLAAAASGAAGGKGDVVVVAGGIGLAPLRGAVVELLATRASGRVVVLVGAREPGQLVFEDELAAWSSGGAAVRVTVDAAAPGWSGHVGLVTSLVDEAPFEPSTAGALVCGPEVMMRFTARSLVDRGVDPARIQVSLERNMQCGVGWCGHCQLGPYLLCRDGPVLPYAGRVAELLAERER